jgi:hypothetical protein
LGVRQFITSLLSTLPTLNQKNETNLASFNIYLCRDEEEDNPPLKLRIQKPSSAELRLFPKAL